ncbi:MAG: MerR family transcriptional regulator [Eubacteriales bacterium]
MEYTIQKMAALAGISTRTLRYYESFGLIRTKRRTSGYRVYGQTEVDRLQLIMFFRELGMSLETIRGILASDHFDRSRILREHLALLQSRKEQLEKLITNVEKTIDVQEGRITMTDSEKFEGLSQKMIDENEEKYGKEIRVRYGEEAVDLANQKLKKMTNEDHRQLEALSLELNEAIKAAFKTGDPAGLPAQKACELHKKWLMNYWDTYSKESHLALAQGYVDDARFAAYYDKIAPGCAVFLRDAIRIYTAGEETGDAK